VKPGSNVTDDWLQDAPTHSSESTMPGQFTNTPKYEAISPIVESVHWKSKESEYFQD